MRFHRPGNILAGFHMSRIDPAVPELVHIGEQWAAESYVIGKHAHDVWEFYLQLDGVSEWAAHGKRFVLKPGGFFAAVPGVEHAMRDRPKRKHHFFFAAIDLKPVLARHPNLAPHWQERGGECVFFPHGESLRAPFRQLIREVSMRLPHRAEGLRAALDYVVIEASRLFEAAARGQESIVAMHPAVQQARQMLELHHAEPWRLDDLGKLVGVSPNHLVQLFTREVGVSPHQYLVQQRIERAKELLRDTDVAITQLALDLGFSSSQHFAKIFKQKTKCSALEFRQRAQHIGRARSRDDR